MTSFLYNYLKDNSNAQSYLQSDYEIEDEVVYIQSNDKKIPLKYLEIIICKI